MTELIDVNGLHVVDPDDFVATRTAVSKALKAAGDPERAAVVAAMRKPPRSAWALNRVAREQPDLVADALEAAGALGAAISGGGDVRTAMGDYRAATDALLDAAGALPGVGGLDWRGRMQGTVLAAGADPAVAEQLRSGTLTVDLPSPGVEALLPAGAGPGGRGGRGGGGSKRAPAPRAPTRREATTSSRASSAADDLAARRAAKAAERAAAEEAARLRREAARERARVLKEVEQLRRRVERLDEVAATARRRADEAAAAAAEARDELAAAEGRLAD